MKKETLLLLLAASLLVLCLVCGWAQLTFVGWPFQKIRFLLGMVGSVIVLHWIKYTRTATPENSPEQCPIIQYITYLFACVLGWGGIGLAVLIMIAAMIGQRSLHSDQVHFGIVCMLAGWAGIAFSGVLCPSKESKPSLQ